MSTAMTWPSLTGRLRAAGVTYRQVDYWVRSGHLAGGTPGSGISRHITARDVDMACTMGPLVRAGMTPTLAAAVARANLAGHPYRSGPVTIAVRKPRRPRLLTAARAGGAA